MITTDYIYAECIGKANPNTIELFPDVILNLFEDEIGFRTGFISSNVLNLNSFADIVNNSTGKRKDWKCAFSTNRIHSDDLILNLLKESATILLPDQYNRLKILPLQQISTSKTITTDDLIITDKNKFYFFVSRYAYSNTFNSFVLNYCFDYTSLTNRSKNYLLQEFCNPLSTSLVGSENVYNFTTYTNLCYLSQLNAKSQLTLTFNADYIRERATAVKLLQWLVLWNTNPKYEVEFQAHYNLNTADLEIGDQIKINIDLLPSDVSLNSNFMIINISNDYLNSKVSIKAIELSF